MVCNFLLLEIILKFIYLILEVLIEFNNYTHIEIVVNEGVLSIWAPISCACRYYILIECPTLSLLFNSSTLRKNPAFFLIFWSSLAGGLNETTWFNQTPLEVRLECRLLIWYTLFQVFFEYLLLDFKHLILLRFFSECVFELLFLLFKGFHGLSHLKYLIVELKWYFRVYALWNIFIGCFNYIRIYVRRITLYLFITFLLGYCWTFLIGIDLVLIVRKLGLRSFVLNHILLAIYYVSQIFVLLLQFSILISNNLHLVNLILEFKNAFFENLVVLL